MILPEEYRVRLDQMVRRYVEAIKARYAKTNYWVIEGHVGNMRGEVELITTRATTGAGVLDIFRGPSEEFANPVERDSRIRPFVLDVWPRDDQWQSNKYYFAVFDRNILGQEPTTSNGLLIAPDGSLYPITCTRTLAFAVGGRIVIEDFVITNKSLPDGEGKSCPFIVDLGERIAILPGTKLKVGMDIEVGGRSFKFGHIPRSEFKTLAKGVYDLSAIMELLRSLEENTTY